MQFNRRNAQQERNKHELTRARKDLDRVTAQLEAEKKRNADRLQTAQNDCDQLRPQVNMLQQEVAALHAELREKTGRCSALEHQTEALERERVQLRAEVGRLTEVVARLERCLHEKTAAETELTRKQQLDHAAHAMSEAGHEQMLQQLGEAHGRAIEGLKLTLQQSHDQNAHALRQQEEVHRQAMQAMQDTYEDQLKQTASQVHLAVQADHIHQEQAAEFRASVLEDAKETKLREYKELEDELLAIRTEYGEQDRLMREELGRAQTQVQMLSNELTLSRLALAQKQELEDGLSLSIHSMRNSLH